ncbi:hypothetical protein [Amycolatopsis anabasis]|uniref:hypothetical protein n=1 Tax=Amycolatopsis anabasis TaxID=1840409 RepID=UPI00131C1972|nr:hypothetical protein [Amycolatopsis anabasis]
MQRTVTRVLLIALGVSIAVAGVWAQFFPASFYPDFPGFRSAWISLDGPFNEHLIRDVGGLFLALCVLSLGAAVIGSTAAARLAALAWLAYSVPHFGYHVTHLHHFETVDRVLIAATTAAIVVLPLAVLAIPGRRET